LAEEDVMPQTVDQKTVRSWTEELSALDERIAPYFSRSEVRRRVQDYLRGLLSAAERKNGWQLPKWRETLHPMAYSICWGEPTGTPISCATP